MFLQNTTITDAKKTFFMRSAILVSKMSLKTKISFAWKETLNIKVVETYKIHIFPS